jgi:hypothetical protein
MRCPRRGHEVPEPVGGTSAAAPFWASATLLAQQYARRQGVESRCFTG